LHLVASEHGGDIMCSAEHNGDIFERTTIEALLDRFHRLLASAIEVPDRPTGDLDWLSLDELSRIVRAWNETSVPYAWSAPVPARPRPSPSRGTRSTAGRSSGGAIASPAPSWRAERDRACAWASPWSARSPWWSASSGSSGREHVRPPRSVLPDGAPRPHGRG